MILPGRTTPPKLQPGDTIAVLSPAAAAPAVSEAVHEQAIARLAEITGLEVVEFPTTRQAGASPEARANDVNAAFADPDVRAIIATLGGDDQITVVPHLDSRLALADPKPFFGYSDNTNILNWLWRLGINGYYGGSTQVHLGAGPAVDDAHVRTLRAALFETGPIEIPHVPESEDFGPDWRTPEALTEFGAREAVGPWLWAGGDRLVEGPTWGGCLEVLDQLALADRLPSLHALEGSVLLLETSEELPDPVAVGRIVRGLGERGVFGVVKSVLVARPPVENHTVRLDARERRAARTAQARVVIDTIAQYSTSVSVCVGASFGHTRPQVIVPYGGRMRVDPVLQQVTALY